MKRIPLIRLLVLGAMVAVLAAFSVPPITEAQTAGTIDGRIAAARFAGRVGAPVPLMVEPAQGLTNAQIFALRYDVGTNQRAAVAVAKQAAFVIAGGGDQTTLPRALEVMNNPEAERENFIWYIVLNTTFQGAQTDANMEAVVATHYDEIWAPED